MRIHMSTFNLAIEPNSLFFLLIKTSKSFKRCSEVGSCFGWMSLRSLVSVAEVQFTAIPRFSDIVSRHIIMARLNKPL